MSQVLFRHLKLSLHQLVYDEDNSIKKMMNDGIKCDGDVYAGVYTPLEFMSNFKGDCDSRT